MTTKELLTLLITGQWEEEPGISESRCIILGTKERGFINVRWVSGDNNTAGVHTKNVSKKLFDKYSAELVG